MNTKLSLLLVGFAVLSVTSSTICMQDSKEERDARARHHFKDEVHQPCLDICNQLFFTRDFQALQKDMISYYLLKKHVIKFQDKHCRAVCDQQLAAFEKSLTEKK